MYQRMGTCLNLLHEYVFQFKFCATSRSSLIIVCMNELRGLKTPHTGGLAAMRRRPLRTTMSDAEVERRTGTAAERGFIIGVW